MAKVFWLIGRGASIDCKLTWDDAWRYCGLPRWRRIVRIKQKIRQQMGLPTVDTESYRNLLRYLSNQTVQDIKHQFVTTNWDYLLQLEVSRNLHGDVQPDWIANSWVAHINGSAEILQDNSRRSPFLLATDNKSERKWSLEAGDTFNAMCWEKFFVVVGMRFECETDKFLVEALGEFEDDLLVGESHWIIVNPDSLILAKTDKLIKKHLPNAKVILVCTYFGEWISQGLPELKKLNLIY